jgi:hypothetical protein
MVGRTCRAADDFFEQVECSFLFRLGGQLRCSGRPLVPLRRFQWNMEVRPSELATEGNTPVWNWLSFPHPNSTCTQTTELENRILISDFQA